MATKTGVYPVYENQFQVGATKEALTDIADMEQKSGIRQTKKDGLED